MVLSWKPTSLLISTCCKKSLPVCIFFSAVAVHSDSVHSVQCSCVLHLRLLCASVHTPPRVTARCCTLDPPPSPSVSALGGCSVRAHWTPPPPCTLDPAPSVSGRCSRQISLFHAAASPGNQLDNVTMCLPSPPQVCIRNQETRMFLCRAERKLTFSQL